MDIKRRQAVVARTSGICWVPCYSHFDLDRERVQISQMKLNLGCGFRHEPGWVNVDRQSTCGPDVEVDLERMPWPWPDSGVSAVKLTHVLEHLGQDPSVFLTIMKELWRVCVDGATIEIVAPHPRSDEFLWDPTHVRPITLGGLRMFHQDRNRRLLDEQNPETPLGLLLGVDFEPISSRYEWRRPWRERLARGEISEEELLALVETQFNVAKEIHVTLQIHKPPSSARPSTRSNAEGSSGTT